MKGTEIVRRIYDLGSGCLEGKHKFKKELLFTQKSDIITMCSNQRACKKITNMTKQDIVVSKGVAYEKIFAITFVYRFDDVFHFM